MRRSLCLLLVVSSACAAQRAQGPLAIPLGLTQVDAHRALKAYDFCGKIDGPVPLEETVPTCDHPGLGRGDAWVVARYQDGVLIGLQRFERWADPKAASERWDQLIAKRSESTPPSTGAREQLEARHPAPAGTQAWVAFSSGDELIGVYLLTPSTPDDPSILEEILPAIP
ncbi:MAG TPA: hypothetical protein VHE35_37140 [Kofleriaceae bacterium]|nr:hypothetical protein [Kofleriaceae bacterium]